MTLASNPNKNLLSIDSTRMHNQMKKSPRREKESGKEMRRDREYRNYKINKKNRKIEKKEKREENLKKSINQLKINKKI